MKKEKRKKEVDILNIKPIPKKTWIVWLKRAEKGDCPKNDLHIILDKKFNTPDIYYDDDIDDEIKVSIRRRKTAEYSAFYHAICSKCNIDKNKKYKPLKNKIQALLRNPDYLKLIHEIKELEEKYDGGFLFENDHYNALYYKLLDVYKLVSPIYKLEKEIFCSHNFADYFDIGEEYDDEVQVKFPVRVISKKISHKVETSDGRFLTWDYKSDLINGKWLQVEINLSQKKKIIIDKIRELIDSYKIYVDSIPLRNKKTIFDPFMIYDMHHIQGLNLAQIAKKLSGINANPSYNGEVMRVYKAVKRAYDKACQLVNNTQKK